MRCCSNVCTFEVFSNAEGGDVRNILFRVLNPNSIRVSTSTTLSRRASFLSREEEELRHKTFVSLLRRKKREEKRSQHLYLSLVVDLSHSSGRRVCVSVCLSFRRKRKREREKFLTPLKSDNIKRIMMMINVLRCPRNIGVVANNNQLNTRSDRCSSSHSTKSTNTNSRRRKGVVLSSFGEA